MIGPFLPSPESQPYGSPSTARRLLSSWEEECIPRTATTDLVRLLTLIMLGIGHDLDGIPAVKGQLGGPSKAEMVGRAVGLAHSMNLRVKAAKLDASSPLDPDTDSNWAVRAWWVLVMLDRWTALGAATPALIDNDSAVIVPALKQLVGEVVYHLIREYSLLFFPSSGMGSNNNHRDIGPPRADHPARHYLPSRARCLQQGHLRLHRRHERRGRTASPSQ